jgi:cell division protein FtsB
MRWLAVILLALIAALQYPLWLGKGSWIAVHELDRQIAAQRDANAKLKQRNAALDADVRDLKAGSEAIEERARAELGMVKQDEVFFQLQPPGSTSGNAASPGAATHVTAPAATAAVTSEPKPPVAPVTASGSASTPSDASKSPR